MPEVALLGPPGDLQSRGLITDVQQVPISQRRAAADQESVSVIAHTELLSHDLLQFMLLKVECVKFMEYNIHKYVFSGV